MKFNESSIRDYIRKIILEEFEDDLDEASTSSATPGYNIPGAFKKTNGTDSDSEPDSEHTKRINKSTGYIKVNENRWLELKRDESSPRKKMAKGIMDIKHSLSDIEKRLEWYSKLKEESGVSGEDYWVNTKKDLKRIKERVTRIAMKMEKL